MDTSKTAPPPIKAKHLKQLNQEWNRLFVEFSENKNSSLYLDKVFNELNWQLWIEFIRKTLIYFILIITIFILIYYIPILNWNVSAIGRIGMIQLLNLWNWEYLYNADCLMPSFGLICGGNNEYPIEINKDNSVIDACNFCENIDTLLRLPPLNDIDSFEYYLHQNQPVIIEKSFTSTTASTPVFDFLLNSTKLSNSRPCDIQSNIQIPNSGKLNDILERLMVPSSILTGENNWFLSFRNCEFDAIKESRLLWLRPNYLPLHLKPFTASWIIISQQQENGVKFVSRQQRKNTRDRRQWRLKSLNLQGLILVQQLIGKHYINLKPKNCEGICEEFDNILYSGDVLIFHSNIWNFSYLPYTPASDDDSEYNDNGEGDGDDGGGAEDLAMSFLTEFDWNS